MSLRRQGVVIALLLAALFAPGAARDEPARPFRVALLPSIDLAEGGAPRPAVDGLLRQRLAAAGLDVVPPEQLETVLRRYRMRWTGGADLADLGRLREEAGADAVLATSIDLYRDGPPPRVALNARLVSTRDGSILWADAAALAGEDSPGLLGLGLVEDPSQLLEKAVARLAATLPVERLGRGTVEGELGHPVWRHERGRREHRPHRVFRDAGLDAAREAPYRVAVIPFRNLTRRPDAGLVVAGLFVTHLAGRRPFRVLEPGEVRERLLEGRVIQEQGVSLAQADILRELLDAELAVTGSVTEFEDRGPGATPRVAFTVWVIDTARRKLVWSAHSANRGDDGVVFFDHGRLRSAVSLADRMVLAAAHAFERGRPTRPAAGGS